MKSKISNREKKTLTTDLSHLEWNSIADWLEKELSAAFGSPFDFDSWNYENDSAVQVNGIWEIPSVRISGDECGFFLFTNPGSVASKLEPLLTDFHLFLKTLAIDWKVYCYEHRWVEKKWKCSIPPSFVISKQEILAFESVFD